MQTQQPERRQFLKNAVAATAATLTTNIFTRSLKGANDRIAVGFIGMGQMGRANLSVALNRPDIAVVAVCDVFQPNLDYAVQLTQKQAKPVKDFREILADKSVDAVCIASPDHWHPYMTVEACKAGKDVYVEKPISVSVDEGRKMVEAARKYNRVVQAGTMQRSAEHFQKAIEIVKSGALGKITEARTWNYGHMPKDGMGNPADSDPASGLDWDFWLGPAPKHPYNLNRFGYDIQNIEHPRWFSNFRWFWDYAGGMMTDWGVHLLDIVQATQNEEQPTVVTASGGKYFVTDNRETPDTLQVTYEYPSGMIATYENRNNNGQSMFKKDYGILFFGESGTMFVDRSEFFILPETKDGNKDGDPMMPEQSMKAVSQGNANHWANFASCIKSRQRPVCDIEICYKSTATCLLGNVALRSGERIAFDSEKQTIKNGHLNHWLTREHRKPWTLSV